MKYRFIPAFIMLLAGLVCCILSIVQRWPVQMSMVVLIIVLLVFYIIGQIAAQIVGKVYAERIALEEEAKKRREEEEELLAKEQEEQERLRRMEVPDEDEFDEQE